VMLKIPLQCLYKNLNPKLTYEIGSSNEHQSQEDKKTKCNQYKTLPDLIRYVGCTSQLQWITRQQTSVNKQSKQATQTHFKPKLKTKGVTKGLNQRQDPKIQTNHRSLRLDKSDMITKSENSAIFPIYRGCHGSDDLQHVTSHLSTVVQQVTPCKFFKKRDLTQIQSDLRDPTSEGVLGKKTTKSKQRIKGKGF
jgi:hypothetical protein